MKIRPSSFRAGPMYAYMDKLSADFNVPIYNSNTLKLPPDKGAGFVKNIFLEEDFCIRYYHFHLKTAMPFSWFYSWESEEELYKLVFTCSAKNLLAGNKDEIKCHDANSSALYANAAVNASQLIPANMQVTKVALLFTREWLEENFPDACNIIVQLLQQLDSDKKPGFITQAMNHLFYSMVNEMVDQMDKDIFPVIHIKTKSLILLTDFLNKVLEASDAKHLEQKSLYHDTIVKVEERLRQYLLGSMPSIAMLAAEFSMSPSTLQRHFKIVYGKNIYQYYLEEKLAIGRELIASRKKTISEVAYMLGYNKINSFSKVFKKYFGVLPKEMQALKS